MKRLDFHLLFLSIIPALWLAIGSSLFITDPQTTIDGRDVTFTRGTPFGTVHARWKSEIVVLDGTAFECSSGVWRNSVYQPTKGDAITYQIEDWALPCLARGANYTITTTRQVMIWDTIPLRPFTTVDLITVTP